LPRLKRARFSRPLVYHSESFADSLPRQVEEKNEKGEASSLPYTGRTVTENAWYLWVITIVLLDSFQIYVNNSFILK
jgi:hypothetical protein